MRDTSVGTCATPDLDDREVFWAAEDLRLLSVQSRLRILFLLRSGEYNSAEIARATGKSLAVTSSLFKPLLVRGIIEKRRDGQHNVYAISESWRPVVDQIEALSACG